MKHGNTVTNLKLLYRFAISYLIAYKYILLQYRVSAVISNAAYILVLDCDMFCNAPASARQALCFHLDPKISLSLAFVQFPQKYHNISKNDIYDSQHRSAYKVKDTKQDLSSFDIIFKMTLYFTMFLPTTLGSMARYGWA